MIDDVQSLRPSAPRKTCAACWLSVGWCQHQIMTTSTSLGRVACKEAAAASTRLACDHQVITNNTDAEHVDLQHKSRNISVPNDTSLPRVPVQAMIDEPLRLSTDAQLRGRLLSFGLVNRNGFSG